MDFTTSNPKSPLKFSKNPKILPKYTSSGLKASKSSLSGPFNSNNSNRLFLERYQINTRVCSDHNARARLDNSRVSSQGQSLENLSTTSDVVPPNFPRTSKELNNITSEWDPPCYGQVRILEDEYEIEKLLQKRRIRRGRGWSTQYLLRWLIYGPEDDTWETEQELRRYANDVVEAYEAANGPGVGIARELPEPDRR